MSKLQQLNVFITERLTTAAVEIFGSAEKTLAVYQERLTTAAVEIFVVVEKTIAEVQGENDRLRGLLLDHLGAVNPDSSAALSEIIVSIDEDESEELPSGSKRTRGKKGQTSQVCTEAKTTSELKAPLKSHTSRRPYKCHFCPKSFISSISLKLHHK
ncbi:unnamed protein product, partial [Coregonus sp. 'balchen']